MAKENKRIRGVLLDPENRTVSPHTLADTLDAYYQALHCDTIDIVSRRIGDSMYAIVCDDEGLMKENPFITAVSEKTEAMLVGALFICADDTEHAGEMRSLTKGEIDEVLSHIRYGMTEAHMKPYPIVCGMEYR